MELSFQHPIDYLNLNYEDWRIGVYSQKDDTIFVIDAQQLKGDKYEIGKGSGEARRYKLNMKVESMYFYFDSYLVLGTKDQSIKMMPLNIYSEEEKEK